MFYYPWLAKLLSVFLKYQSICGFVIHSYKLPFDNPWNREHIKPDLHNRQYEFLGVLRVM